MMCAQYSLESEKERVNALIENAILDADSEGCKVISLGMLNKVCIASLHLCILFP